MTFNLIVTCVSEKKTTKCHSILDSELKRGSPKQVFEQWVEILQKSSYKKVVAKELYSGTLWKKCLDIHELVKCHIGKCNLWILSAGYGLLNPMEEIIPYDITFQDSKDKIPSLLTKIDYSEIINTKRMVLQSWWELLTENSPRNPKTIEELIKNAQKNDFFFFVLGKDYLDAVFQDLKRGLGWSKDIYKIALISNTTQNPMAKRIPENWLYCDERFLNLPATNSTLVNIKIAELLLKEMFENQNGLAWWGLENFNSFLKSKVEKLIPPKKFNRTVRTDEEVKQYIKTAFEKEDISFTKLHRRYRDSGQACEYSRFKKIYNEVKNTCKRDQNKKILNLPGF
ncbi:DUF6884 domain-containing protein [Candidatus Riflebacteria bacterium]